MSEKQRFKKNINKSLQKRQLRMELIMSQSTTLQIGLNLNLMVIFILIQPIFPTGGL